MSSWKTDIVIVARSKVNEHTDIVIVTRSKVNEHTDDVHRMFN